MQRRARICMITMFRNESTVIRRMLESCAPYIDYWVIQNNGSTDGTDTIVQEFFQENPIPGYFYEVEEGWKGFGWNRDHLIQTCQKINHGCDWILKMDCDEILEVDNDFDWSLLEDISVQAWDIPAVSGNTVYYRTWLYNARLPWRFNHDPCHETVYCDLEGIGLNYRSRSLPWGFRHINSNQGQSWGSPTKFITDALVLEEKMIREQNMLDNLYHFFYIGKSYNDAYPSTAFPLGRSQQREYASRAIYYLHEYILHSRAGKNPGIDEMAYNAYLMMAECYDFLEQPEAALSCYKTAEQFAPERNEHLFAMALIYKRLRRFQDMLDITTEMMRPQRIMPFPRYSMFIDRSMYVDQGNRVQDLHLEAMALNRATGTTGYLSMPSETQPTNTVPNGDASSADLFPINSDLRSRLFVVDDFYQDPDAVRAWAMTQEFQPDIRWYKGLRSKTVYRPQSLKQRFESIIGRPIKNWDAHGFNGCFQITTAEDPQVYHNDLQTWAAMIYLTPGAPVTSGTRLHRSRINGARHLDQDHAIIDGAFAGGFYDSSKFETIDTAGNVYNRLVIMDAKHIHSAGEYFGSSPDTGRLVHLFFFD